MQGNLPEIQNNRARSSNRTSIRATPTNNGTSMSSEKGRNIKQSLLTKKEMIMWGKVKEKHFAESSKLRDLSNPEVCDKIRILLNPPVWKYWGKNRVEGKTSAENSPERVGSNNFFPALK